MVFVAQSGERRFVEPRVVGSKPTIHPKEFTTDKALASELRMSSRRFNRLDYRKFDTIDWWDASG